jgi:hypothetical protein
MDLMILDGTSEENQQYAADVIANDFIKAPLTIAVENTQ